MQIWRCPQCKTSDRTWTTDNCQWDDDDRYYMEYLCENCNCVYYVYLTVEESGIVFDGTMTKGEN